MNFTYPLIKKLLFQLPPEIAHEISLSILRKLEQMRLLTAISPKLKNKPVHCMGLDFPNPIGVAAGLDKTGCCINALGCLGFGFIEVGTFTPKAQAGNPKPRLFRLPKHQAIINQMGFNNPSIDLGIQNIQQNRQRFNYPVGINIGKNKLTPNTKAIDDYLYGFKVAYPHADYITINLSSPNTPKLRDLQAPQEASKLISTIKKQQAQLHREHKRFVPLVFKISPDLSKKEITTLSQVFMAEGLDGLIATNTTLDRPAKLKNSKYHDQQGGLSGSPLHVKSLSVISSFHSHLENQVPIIGVGGITDAKSAKETLDAGAQLIQLYTGFIYSGPPLIKKIIQQLSEKTN